MKFTGHKVQVTVNFAVVGLTAEALGDLRGVIGDGKAALIERSKGLAGAALVPIQRRIEVAEEFLRNLDELESVMHNHTESR